MACGCSVPGWILWGFRSISETVPHLHVYESANTPGETRVAPLSSVRGYPLCELSTVLHVLFGAVALSTQPAFELPAELFQLGWPVETLTCTMRSFAVRGGTGFAMLVRSSGKVLQHLQVHVWASAEICPRLHNFLVRFAKRLDSGNGLGVPSSCLAEAEVISEKVFDSLTDARSSYFGGEKVATGKKASHGARGSAGAGPSASACASGSDDADSVASAVIRKLRNVTSDESVVAMGSYGGSGESCEEGSLWFALQSKLRDKEASDFADTAGASAYYFDLENGEDEK